MDFQGNRVFNVEERYISNPENDEFVTIYRNKLDNKYYGRKADGTDEPLGGGGSGVTCFSKSIIPGFNIADEITTNDECFIILQPGTYIFDVDSNHEVLFSVSGVGQPTAIISTNTDESINISPGDVQISSREIFNPIAEVGSKVNIHDMTGPVIMAQPFSFKAYFVDNTGFGIKVSNVKMRAIKIA